MYYLTGYVRLDLRITYTVKLARAKLPTNAGNITSSSLVKKTHTQFTGVTCSLPVKTNKLTCFYVASTSRKIHANFLQSHVYLPEYNGYFTGKLTCGTHAVLPGTSIQNCLLLQANIHAVCRQERLQSKVKIPHKHKRKQMQTQAEILRQPLANILSFVHKITCNCRQPAITPRVSLPAN